MSTTNVTLLIFGLGTCARGVYALVTQDIIDEANGSLGGPPPVTLRFLS